MMTKYSEMWSAKASELYACEGCGRSDRRIMPSHRVPRSRNKALEADPDNVDGYCLSCHEKVELGRFDELLNGEEVKEYIKKHDLEYYLIKVNKWT